MAQRFVLMNLQGLSLKGSSGRFLLWRGALVLSMLYSCILFKEKLSLPQGIGIALSMVSIIALSL